MILNCSINSSIEINSLLDLPRLKVLMEELHLKVNKSKIARELGVDRRLIDKYMNGYKKPTKRKKASILDAYYDIIKNLLIKQNTQVFFYKKFYGNT